LILGDMTGTDHAEHLEFDARFVDILGAHGKTIDGRICERGHELGGHHILGDNTTRHQTTVDFDRGEARATTDHDFRGFG